MAAAMFSKFKKKSQKGGKTRHDVKNENALGNSTRDETGEAGSLKSGPQDEKSQKQQYDNSNGSSKPSKGQPMMSLSPDHPGSPDCSLVVGCPSSSESPEMKTMKKNKSLATDISGANATPVESTGPQIPVNNAASANLFTPPGLRASKSHLGDSDAQNSKNIVTSSSGVTDYSYSSGPSTAASTCTNLPTQMPQIDVEVADQQQGSPCNTQSVSDTSSRSALSQNPENSEVSSSELAASNQASQMNQPAINTRDPPNPEMEDLSGVSRNENDNSLESLSAHPIQEEQNNAEASQNEATVNTYDNFFVSEKILGDKFLLEKLAVRLDRTPNRAIKSWEHLACTKEIAAPLEVRLKCKLSSEKRYTMMLFEVLTAEHEEDKTVKDLMDALTRMKRNDVKKIITDVFPDAANSSQELSEFIASPNKFNAVADVATLLDQTSNVNKYWFHLGLEFGVSRVRLKEIEYGQSTQDLMEYLYTKKPRLTIGTFCGVIENDLKRKDVLKILRPFVEEVGGREKMMKDVIPLESDTMRSICVCLNNPSRVLRNWRYLAKSPELGIPDEVYMDCKPDKLKSPTEGILEWATANRNDLKIGELCSALKSMDRNDIVGYIAEYFQQQSTAVQQH